jgi:hypothetical protein
MQALSKLAVEIALNPGYYKKNSVPSSWLGVTPRSPILDSHSLDLAYSLDLAQTSVPIEQTDKSFIFPILARIRFINPVDVIGQYKSCNTQICH